MSDKKTTIAGYVKAIAACLLLINVNIDSDMQMAITNGAFAIVILASTIQAKFTKDADK